jgi:ParB-like chromosome segregation protein Spo0J
MNEVTAEFMRVTSAIAKEWLEKSDIKNRDFRPSNLKALTEAMLRGKFMLNGEAIIFDDRDNILDGHHRLEACVKADVPFDSLIVRGIDRRAISTIDTGASRDIVDDLTIASPAHRIINIRVGKILPLIIKYSKPTLAPYWKTVPGRKEILDSNPEIIEAAAAVKISGKPLMRESVLGAIQYLGSIAHREKTETFIKQLIEGVGLEQYMPAHTVREYLIATGRRLSSTRSQMSNWEVFRACCLGLDRFISEEQLRIVRVPKRPLVPGADPKEIAQKLGVEDAQ